MNVNHLSNEELLRAAIKLQMTSDSSPELQDFKLNQLYSGIVIGDPEAEKVWAEETSPEQATLDLHLEGDNIHENSTNAKKFTDFISGLILAVKETVKDRLGRGSYVEDLLIQGALPGSVRIILRAPIPSISLEAIVDTATIASTADSDAIRSIASILKHADDEAEDSPLMAEVHGLPMQARMGLKRVAKSVSKAGWNIEGTISQRGFESGAINLSIQGAKRLEHALIANVPMRRTEIMFGLVHGTKDIEGIMWFQPENGRVFRAKMKDDNNFRKKAIELQIDHPRVRAVFEIFESIPVGDQTASKVSRVLQELELATPLGVQGSLDADATE
ncbi:MAG: hypothetical protein ACRCSF_01410 [Mycobacteriaceae bacterium]